MTNADRIVAALRAHGALTDAQLCRLTGIEPHQQVNQICRRLEAQGVLRRTRGSDGRIVNVLAEETAPGTSDGLPDEWILEMPQPQPSTSPGTPTPATVDRVQPGRRLFVIQCSKRKVPGGQPRLAGPSVTGLLDDDLADRLSRARAALRSKSRLDESRLLPAWQRYSGTLYETAGDAVGRAVEDGLPIVIISGGYGLLLADEPIGTYDRKFSLSAWPRRLLQDCLVALSQRLGAERVLAFCSGSTDYARLVRQTPWGQAGLEAALASPDMDGRGGAQVLVPRASGEALGAALAGRLGSPRASSDGVALRTEILA
jgi:hypothetical protein